VRFQLLDILPNIENPVTGRLAGRRRAVRASAGHRPAGRAA